MYTYDITTQIESAKLDTDRLEGEINTSSISQTLERLELVDITLTVVFVNEITEAEKLILDAVVLSHSGEPLEEVSAVPLEIQSTQYAFADKVTKDGKKLFRRKHGILPKDVLPGTSQIFELVVPYMQCKINKLEIIGANNNDLIDLIILDSETGLIQQQMGLPANAITPFLPLNQFGFDVCVSKDYYADASNYDAEIYAGMVVHLVYYNKSSETTKVGANITLHELK